MIIDTFELDRALKRKYLLKNNLAQKYMDNVLKQKKELLETLSIREVYDIYGLNVFAWTNTPQGMAFWARHYTLMNQEVYKKMRQYYDHKNAFNFNWESI